MSFGNESLMYFPDMVDSWRCLSCERLMYNTSVEGGNLVPCAGAPLPLYATSKYHTVCSLCWEMYEALNKIDSDYWADPPARKLNPDNSLEAMLRSK